MDSNDTLYGSDPKFISEINKICSVLLEEILAHLKYLNTNEQFQKQVKEVCNKWSRIIVKIMCKMPYLLHYALTLYSRITSIKSVMFGQ